MSIFRYATALSVFLVNYCIAQTFTFDPPNPQAGQKFSINAVWPNSGRSVKTQGYVFAPNLHSYPDPSDGGRINVWFVQDGNGFATPPPGLVIRAAQDIDGLPAGTYTVSVNWIPDPDPLVNTAANSPQTFQLVVGGNSTGEPPESFVIGNGITGNWYNPDQSGHGFSLEVLPGGTLLAEWFVFSPTGSRDWIAASGPINGNTATLNAFRTDGSGGQFPPHFNAAAVQQQSWGIITFAFSDCNNGTVAWQSTQSGYAPGSLPITRLTTPNGLHCP
ncbi:MAG: hypothetical protein DYH18_10465 [Xanthomonadales bacterium PRO7]|nr:hypothetical protein [Xanthomonadales bacterium PRO7]